MRPATAALILPPVCARAGRRLVAGPAVTPLVSTDWLKPISARPVS